MNGFVLSIRFVEYSIEYFVSFYHHKPLKYRLSISRFFCYEVKATKHRQRATMADLFVELSRKPSKKIFKHKFYGFPFNTQRPHYETHSLYDAMPYQIHLESINIRSLLLVEPPPRADSPSFFGVIV